MLKQNKNHGGYTVCTSVKFLDDVMKLKLVCFLVQGWMSFLTESCLVKIQFLVPRCFQLWSFFKKLGISSAVGEYMFFCAPLIFYKQLNDSFLKLVVVLFVFIEKPPLFSLKQNLEISAPRETSSAPETQGYNAHSTTLFSTPQVVMILR